jgi:hypothetical protein
MAEVLSLLGNLPFLRSCLASEPVEGLALAFEGVDDVHGSDSLAASVLSVGDGIANDILQEDLEDTSGFFVDETGDTLDAPTSRQTTDGGLRDSLDIISENLTVTLGASLSEPFSSFSST